MIDVPPIPIESQVKETINEILNSGKDEIDIAIDLCMYCMRTQIFIDGNKRASVIFANHYMIRTSENKKICAISTPACKEV